VPVRLGPGPRSRESGLSGGGAGPGGAGRVARPAPGPGVVTSYKAVKLPLCGVDLSTPPLAYIIYTLHYSSALSPSRGLGHAHRVNARA
jgi:hypothetical protein